MAFAERIFLCLLRNKRERHCTYTSGMIQPTSRQGHRGAPDVGANGQIVIECGVGSPCIAGKALEAPPAPKHAVHDDGELPCYRNRRALEPEILAQGHPSCVGPTGTTPVGNQHHLERRPRDRLAPAKPITASTQTPPWV